jgi:hypothetical protein
VAEFLSEREHLAASNRQNAQDDALTHMYTPQRLLKSCNSAAQENAFPLYEQTIASLPSTSNQLKKIEERRIVIEQNWGQHPLSDVERTQYWQKSDLMSNAVNMRFMYGVTLNNYGYKFNDEAAKAKGLQMLSEASQLQPKTNEFVGALLQANRHEAVNFRKAEMEVAVQTAVSDLPRAQEQDTSWTGGLTRWVESSLGAEDPREHQRLISLAKVSNDLRRAAVVAPITTKEYIDKAAKKLDPDSASILQDAFKKNLHK